MTTEAEALAWYRKLVSRIYREIGAMKRSHHAELYDKSKISPTLGATRKEVAKQMYKESRSDHDVGAIDQQYVKWVGLTLEEVLQAFKEGDWRIRGISDTEEEYSFGGPKWAVIAETTFDLRKAIVNKDWEQASLVVEKVQHLRHNTDVVVKQLKELDS